MARKKSATSGIPSKKTYDFSKYMMSDSPDAEWAKNKHALPPEQVPDLELFSNDIFPSTMSNNELILPNTMEEMTDDGCRNKAGNSSEQAISNIFARVARDSWPFEGEDPIYYSGSRFRNEIETKDMAPWWAVEENDLKSDKNYKIPCKVPSEARLAASGLTCNQVPNLGRCQFNWGSQQVRIEL